jgi:tetratricopeptide (TPR) repeat protein
MNEPALKVSLAAGPAGPQKRPRRQQRRFHLQQFDQSIAWTRKAIEIDPKRAVACQNLGDLYFQLNRPNDARPYYEKYLELAADKPYALTVRARLAKQ